MVATVATTARWSRPETCGGWVPEVAGWLLAGNHSWLGVDYQDGKWSYGNEYQVTTFLSWYMIEMDL
jgi:hypothetical protein